MNKMRKAMLVLIAGLFACGLLATQAHGYQWQASMQGTSGQEASAQVGAMSADALAQMGLAKATQAQGGNGDEEESVEIDSLAQDSVVDVVGYFCKGDTCEYWINEGKWKVNGKDTTKLVDVATKVRLVVTDSTQAGYKMAYTFLEMRMDSTGSHFENEMLRKIMEIGNKSVIGTTVELETNDCGAITKIVNLSQIKKQAKAFFKSSVKALAGMPEMKEMKKMGLDLETVASKAKIDDIVDGYLEELNMLFMLHGNRLPVGEKHDHEAASKDNLENDSYFTVEVDENGGYSITNEVVNVVPKSDVKELMSALGDGLKGVKSMKDENGKKLGDSFKEIVDKEFDKYVTEDAHYTSYYSVSCYNDGWPYEAVKQDKMMIGEVGKLSQTVVSECRFAQKGK